MTTRRLPTRTTTTRQRNRIAATTARLTDDLLDTLRRRAGEPAHPLETGAADTVDGYPPAHHLGRRGHGEHADPTYVRYAAAQHPPDDPVRTAIAELFDRLAVMADAAAAIDRLADYVCNTERANRGRQSAIQGVCLVCDSTVTGVGNDRLRAGYCPACYAAWRRSRWWDTGEHLRFRRERRRELADRQDTDVA